MGDNFHERFLLHMSNTRQLFLKLPGAIKASVSSRVTQVLPADNELTSFAENNEADMKRFVLPD